MDIEIAVGQEFIFGGYKKLRCEKGKSCKKCVIHSETKYNCQLIGNKSYNNQCGGKGDDGFGNGRTCALVCDSETRRDGNDVIFVLVETFSTIE